VKYRLLLATGEEKWIDNPLEYPTDGSVEYAEEPYIKASIISPAEYLGNLINLCLEKRGIQTGMNYLDEKRVEIIYEMPLAEVLFDFYDRLKSSTRGYASFDYELAGYKETSLVKLDILVNGERVDALSQLVHKDNAQARARQICKQLLEEIPRHQFKIPLQGAIGNTIIARETVPALKKDVTAKCYGGDITRKRKLLEKQKEGKKRMKTVGNVELPQSAFVSVLKTERD
jgi:GTP-binding protein LepA